MQTSITRRVLEYWERIQETYKDPGTGILAPAAVAIGRATTALKSRYRRGNRFSSPLAHPLGQKLRKSFSEIGASGPPGSSTALLRTMRRKTQFKAPLCGYNLCAKIAAPDYRGYSTWTCQTL